MRFSKVFNALNKKQRQAVEMPRVPVLMLAGPGTGKTRTLISRIIYQIQSFEIPPENILALTFTNKAAQEMKNRLHEILKDKAEKITTTTIHGFCLDVLRKYYTQAGLARHFTVCPDEYQTNLIHRLIDDKVRSEQAKVVKGIKLSIDHFIMREKPMPPFSAMIYDRYIEHLSRHNLVDFNQILVKTRNLFRDHKDVLDQFTFQYQAIHVDEFQDTDSIQYQIIKMLAGEHRNIFVVADDDQSIYAWRGANPENIKNYMADFHIENPIFLEINYRSGSKIIDTAQQIVKSIERIEPDKEIKAVDLINDSINVRFFDNEQQEIHFIAEIIKQWQDKGVAYSEMAILYPQHRFAEKLSLRFIKDRLPFQQASGRNFQDDPQMKKLLLYLQVIRDPQDTVVLQELVENELGYQVHKQIQNLQNSLNCGYRKALYEFGQRSEVSENLRNELTSFIGHLANLVNLKSFYTFVQLTNQILYGLHDIDTSYIEEKAAGFSDFELNVPNDLFKNAVWIYHPDKTLLYIVKKMLQDLYVQEIKVFSNEATKQPTAKDYCILLAPLSIPLKSKLIDLTKQVSEKRESPFSSLLRLCQGWLVQRDNVFNAYVIFDLETTGKDAETCGIVEIAAVKIKKGQLIDTFQTLINPQMAIEQEAMDVHQISQQDIEAAPVMEEAWPRFREFIADNILVAHNGYNFDFKIIDRFAQQLDGEKLHNGRYDSLIFARKMYPKDHNSIDALSARFNLDPGTRHRALDDVKVLHLIFEKILAAFLEKQKKTSADFLFEYCALANYLENDLLRFEDKVFFLSGAQKLLSPYSKIMAPFCKEFGKDMESFTKKIYEKVQQLYPSMEFYDRNDDFRERVLSIAQEYNASAIDEALAEFLSTIMMINPQDRLSRAEAISLLTFHAAKGLEFQKVIIMGMEDENMPNFFAYRDDDFDDRSQKKKLEEQKRLLYVGLTRAKDEIILSAVKNRFGRQQRSSPFLREIWKYMKENV